MLRRASCASTFGVPFPGDQRGEHVPAGDPEDVGDDRAELDAGVLQQLLGPLLLRRPGGHQVGTVPGQVPQLADRRWRHEAGPEHLPFGDLAQPDRVQLVFSVFGRPGRCLTSLAFTSHVSNPAASSR